MFHVIYIALQIGNELRSLCVQFSPRNCRLNNFAERQILAGGLNRSVVMSRCSKAERD